MRTHKFINSNMNHIEQEYMRTKQVERENMFPSLQKNVGRVNDLEVEVKECSGHGVNQNSLWRSCSLAFSSINKRTRLKEQDG